MYQTKSSCELKQKAKEQLLGNYGKMISALLIYAMIPNIILYIADGLLPPNTTINHILYYIIDFLVLLLTGIFMLGLIKLYMNFSTGRPFQLSDIFYGFHGHQDIGILIMLVMVGITLVYMVPFGISIILYLFLKTAYLYPIMALTLIAGVVLAYMQLLSLSQSFYIAVDFPDYSFKQVLRMSRRIMTGQRARLFYLQVSFLPLMLLCVLTMGLGVLWLSPYMYATQTHFYLDLMDYHTAQYKQSVEK